MFSMSKRWRLATAAGLAGAALLAGCQSNPSPNQGRTKARPVDTRLVEEDGLASKDLVTATDDMVAQIASNSRFRDAPYPVDIVMDRVVNATRSEPNRNFDIYLARIRAQLAQADVPNIRFHFNKTQVVSLRRSEGLEPAPESGLPTFASNVDYALTATFYDLQSGATDTYLLTFQVVDIHSGEIVWEGMYEVKFRA